jgi:hypothetical protein
LVDVLPKDYPFTVEKTARRAENREPNFHIPFFEFRGQGPPAPEIGYNGDLYFDITPNAYALYAKSNTGWHRWSVPRAPWEGAHTLIPHPDFKDAGRFLYCRGPKFSWYSLSSVYSSWRDISRSGLVNGGGKDRKIDLAGVLIAEMLKEEGRLKLKKREREDGDTKLSTATKKRKITSEDELGRSDTPSTTARNSAAMLVTSARPPPSAPIICPPRMMRTCTGSQAVLHNIVKSEHHRYPIPPVHPPPSIQNNFTEDENRLLRNELELLKKEIQRLAAQNQQVLEGNQYMEIENKKLADSAAKDTCSVMGDANPETGIPQRALPPGLIKVLSDAYVEYLNRRKFVPSSRLVFFLTFRVLSE